MLRRFADTRLDASTIENRADPRKDARTLASDPPVTYKA